MSNLRHNPTNSANDSKGHSMGLEGDQFMYIVAALVIGFVLLIVSMKAGASPVQSMIIGAIPIPFVLLFLLIFKINKPEGYQNDLIQSWMGNTAIERKHFPENPYLLAKQGKKAQNQSIFKIKSSRSNES